MAEQEEEERRDGGRGKDGAGSGEGRWRVQPPEGDQGAEGIGRMCRPPGVPGREGTTHMPGKSAVAGKGRGAGPRASIAPSLEKTSAPRGQGKLDAPQFSGLGGPSEDLGLPRGPAGPRCEGGEALEAGIAAHVDHVVDGGGNPSTESEESSAVVIETREGAGPSAGDSVSSSDGREGSASSSEDGGGVKVMSDMSSRAQVAEKAGSRDSDTWKQARDAAASHASVPDTVSCTGSIQDPVPSSVPRSVGHSFLDQGLVVLVQVTVLLSLSLLLWRGLAALAVDLFLA